ncbi:transposase [Mycobacterium tuberculosis]|nr:transposase [Mycobacterium tuberculosis]
MLDTAYRDHLERFVRKPPEPPALPAFSAINPTTKGGPADSINPRKSCLRNVDRFRGRSGDKLDLRIMAMGLGKSPVASDKRYAEALGEGDVGSIGHGMSGPKLVGTLGEWL